MFFDEVKGLKNIITEYVELREEFEKTTDHESKIYLLEEILHYLEKISAELVFWIKQVIQEIYYIVGCIDWFTICITTKSGEREGEIELSKVLNEAIPKEYQKYIEFYSPEVYVNREEAEEIREILDKIFTGMEPS